MGYIPVKSKIALINKYIQLSFLKSGSPSMHKDVSEHDIFSAIIEDINAFNENPEEPKISLKPTIETLRELQNNQSSMQKHIDSLSTFLQSLQEEQENQVNLDTVIKDLEAIDQ